MSLFLDDNQFIRGLRQIQARAHAFGAGLAKIGGVTAGLGAAILGPLAAIFKETAGHFDDVNDAATRLGTTTEIFSNLSHAAEMSGSNAEELESALGKMEKTLSDAAGGGKEADDAFRRLGLSSKNLIGLSLDQQMEAIADALAGVQNPTEKSALAMAIFGKSGRTLLPMLEDGAAGLRAFAEENRKLGGEIGGEQAKQGARAMDAYDRVMKVLKNTIRSVGAAFLPAIEEIETFAKWVINIGGAVRQFIADNRQVIQVVAAVAGGLIVAGSAVAALGGAFMLIGSVIGGGLAVLAAIKAVFLAIISPVGIVVIAVTALAAGLAYLWSTTKDGQGAIAQLKGGLGELAETFSSAFQGVSDALSAGNLALAGRIAFTALNLEFTKALAFMTDRWNAFKSYFVDAFHDGVKLLRLAINDAVTWMQRLFINLGQSIRQAIGGSLTSVLRWALDKYIKFLEFTDILGSNTLQLIGAKSLMEGLTLSPEDAKARLDSAEEDRKKRAAQIEKEAAAAQEARDKARGEDKQALDDKVKRLQRELAELNAQAAEEAWQKALFEATAPGKALAGGAAAAAALATEVRGGFGGNAAQRFGFGDRKGTAEKSLAVQEEMRDGIKDVKVSVDRLDGVAFA